MDQTIEETTTVPEKKKNPMGWVILGVAILIGAYMLITNYRKTPPSNTLGTQTHSSPTKAQTQAMTASPSSAMQANVKEVTVTGANFSFDPKEITVKKGDTVKIVFKNAEGFHDWNLDEFNAHTKKIKANEEDTVQFLADKTGTFEYYCSVGQHRQMGMKGTLIVQ